MKALITIIILLISLSIGSAEYSSKSTHHVLSLSNNDMFGNDNNLVSDSLFKKRFNILGKYRVNMEDLLEDPFFIKVPSNLEKPNIRCFMICQLDGKEYIFIIDLDVYRRININDSIEIYDGAFTLDAVSHLHTCSLDKIKSLDDLYNEVLGK